VLIAGKKKRKWKRKGTFCDSTDKVIPKHIANYNMITTLSLQDMHCKKQQW